MNAAHKPKSLSPYKLFLEAARELAEVRVIKERPRLVRIKFKDGITLSLFGLLRLNEEGAREVTRDKELSGLLMEDDAIHTPRTLLFHVEGDKPTSLAGMQATPEYAGLREFVGAVGWPVFVKPNKGTEGRGVLRVTDWETLDSALLRYAQASRRTLPLVQEALHGAEHRVVIMFGEILLAVRRQPFEVQGDGATPIGRLIEARLRELAAQGRRVKLTLDSEKITSCLSQQQLTRESILTPGARVSVIANNNLSDGARPVASTTAIRARYGELAHQVCDTLNVNFVGIDLIEDDRRGRIVPYVLEANANPGFKQFLNDAPENAALLKEMYRAVILNLHRRKKMERRVRKRRATKLLREPRRQLVGLMRRRVKDLAA